MKGNWLARLYDRLSAAERFRVVLEAIAREDDAEARRLSGTCPRKTYMMADATFTDLLEASQRAAERFALLWLDAHRALALARLGELTFQLAGLSFDRGFWLGLDAGHGTLRARHPVRRTITERAEHLERLRTEAEQASHTAAGRLKGAYQGLVRFCQAARIEHRTLLVAWYAPILADLDAERELLDGAAPADSEAATIVYRLLCRTWPTLETESVGQAASGEDTEATAREPD